MGQLQGARRKRGARGPAIFVPRSIRSLRSILSRDYTIVDSRLIIKIKFCRVSNAESEIAMRHHPYFLGLEGSGDAPPTEPLRFSAAEQLRRAEMT